jgi:Arc/MetJ family transcription regulator
MGKSFFTCSPFSRRQYTTLENGGDLVFHAHAFDLLDESLSQSLLADVRPFRRGVEDWCQILPESAFPREDERGTIFPLTRMHRRYILMHMRTTLNIEAKLIEEAARLTGVTEKTALVRMGLAALIAREGARRLADLGGTEKNLRRPPRRRSVRAA